MADYFLGLDSSTQSLTALLIDFNSSEIIYRNSIIYDKDLPKYQTQNGIYITDDERVVHSSPLMWVEALELLFSKFIKDRLPIKEIKAISGSGQQHGTVYLNNSFEKVLQELDPDQTLVQQLTNVFTRKTSPIWMDSSTNKQCNEIREKLGGLESSIKITGSNTFERFSGPQIRKFYQESLEDYKKTATIHLVSSYMSSILLGKNSPIDHGDGAGMNLMNISKKQWDGRALNATAPKLGEKLPKLVNSYEIVGCISPYFVKRYGFNPNTILIAWSGDNPNSLIGVGLIERGKVAFSLGTSDTYFGYLKELCLDLKGEGHVFGAPTGDYMSLICFKNGSLAREKVKNSYNLDWKQFSSILERTPPGNYGKIILPYFLPEIVPFVLKPKVYRYKLDENDMKGNVRAIIEAQFLSMRLHSSWIGEKPEEIYATGGASANEEILQIAADIFNAKICYFAVTDSAALGAALRAVKSYYNFKRVKITWADLANRFLKIQDSKIIKPNKEHMVLYDDMLVLYEKCENFFLKKGESPNSYHNKFVKKYFKGDNEH